MELPTSSIVSNNVSSKNHHHSSNGAADNTGIEDERVLLLVFRAVAFDPRVVSAAACVSRRLRAVARRVLWRDLCLSRAPHMTSALALGSGGHAPGAGGGWHALAKLLLFCCGVPGRHGVPGHLAPASRFSKTSGRSFLHRRCRGDVLYVSDPCEHPIQGREEDVGVYRGIFLGFVRSRTRAWLVGRRAELESGGARRCPYCWARVWSMNAAGLVPRSASRRLGSHEGGLEYFVCVNGHLHGSCWLAHLSDNDEGGSGGGDEGSCDGAYDDEDDKDDEEEEDDGHAQF